MTVNESAAHIAVIVTRVSSEQQVENTSLKSQLEICRNKCAALGMPIFEEYEDAGKSGAYIESRNGLQSAIADIRAGRADTLVVATLDRYSRNEEHQHRIKREIHEAGGRIIFCDIEFDDSPEGELNFTIQGGFKAYERKVIRKRTMLGKRKCAENGQQPQRSRSPYGYKIGLRKSDGSGVSYTADEIGKYFIDNVKAPIARRIFESYANGTHSLPMICKELNAEGIPGPSGGVWYVGSIKLILVNPVYKGEPVSGRQQTLKDETRLQRTHALTGRPITSPEYRRNYPEEYTIKLSAPEIVSVELWDQVQERLSKMKSARGGNPKRMQMLSGLCRCPICGGNAINKYQQANGKKYSYYICSKFSGSRDVPGQRLCKGDLYPMPRVEAAVLQFLENAWQKPNALAEAVITYQKNNSSPHADKVDLHDLHQIENSLNDLKKEQDTVVKAQIAGMKSGLSADAYDSEFSIIKIRKKELEDQRKSLKRVLSNGSGKNPLLSPDASIILSEQVRRVHDMLSGDTLTGSEKRELVGTVIDNVVCQKEGADVFLTPSAIAYSGSETATNHLTFYTTCIGINTQK
jgi:site-specific DNA recombinase